MHALGKIIVVAIVVVAVVAFLTYRAAFPTYTYRYRMTVEVTVEGQIKSGSGVIQVDVATLPPITDVPPFHSEVTGEAVFVDLGGSRNLFALLVGAGRKGGVDYPYYIVPRHFELSNRDADVARFPKLQGRWELPPDQKCQFS
jgi:hypothetical protein